MILLYDKQIAIVTLPKTGSTSLFETLCKRPHNGVFCIGPSGDQTDYYDHHSVILPQAGFKWKALVVVRHPLQRLVSLWGHLAKEMVMNMETPPSIKDYVYTVSQNRHGFYFYQWNQTKILEKANYEYSIVKTETLEKQLLDYGILNYAGELLNLNVFNITQRSRPYKEVLTEQMIEDLKWWWEPDTIKFDYILS